MAAFDGFTGAADLTGSSNTVDAFTPSQSSGDFVTVRARAHTSIPAWYLRGKDVRGWMVVSLDDRNGAAQAALVRVSGSGH